MILDKLCKDNVLCCDDNCKRCANLIYDKYMEQKAEIERLKNALMGECMLSNCTREAEIKAEAIKEFAERYEKEIETSPNMNIHFKFALLRYARQIKDNLVKEMLTEEKISKVEHNSLCETETYKNSK